MPERGVRSRLTQCPVQIQMCDFGGAIARGSAFVFTSDDEEFLITNWHNVSGRHSFTGKCLDPDLRVPTYLQLRVTAKESSGKHYLGDYRLDLYEESGKPRWFEHPELNSFCDVVAIPFEKPEACPPYMYAPVNAPKSSKIPVEPGGTVFIIGFPLGITVGPNLPIWKAGYIASEPYFDITVDALTAETGEPLAERPLPAFFIDSQTREGMSGAPVFASYTGAWDAADPYATVDFEDPDTVMGPDFILSGTAREFVGCYSGRVADREDGAALGLCWRKDAIESVCSSRAVGKPSLP